MEIWCHAAGIWPTRRSEVFATSSRVASSPGIGLRRYCTKRTVAVNSPHCESHRGVIHKLRKRAVKDCKYDAVQAALMDLEIVSWLFEVSASLLEGPMPTGLKDIDWDYSDNILP